MLRQGADFHWVGVLLLLTLLTLTLFLVSASVALLDIGPHATAQAPGGMEAMSIDMDPAATPGNTATSLGSREFCARVNENDTLDGDEDSTDTLDVDVTATNIPAANPIIAFGYTLHYSEANLTIQSADNNMLLASGPNSSVLDVSDLTPDTDGNDVWKAAAVDLNTGLAGNVPESGSGVLTHLMLSSDAGAVAGIYPLTLTDALHLDAIGTAWAPLATNNAQVAIDQPCGTIVPPTPPTNDDFDSATAIPGLPFSDSADIDGASIEPGEPFGCAFLDRTVWYKFTPAVDQGLRASTVGSSVPQPFMNVYVGPDPASLADLSFQTCGSGVNFRASAGQTYYFQVGDTYGAKSGGLMFNLSEFVSPPNDNLGDAAVIPEPLPFTASESTAGATLEPFEPNFVCAPIDSSVWYAFTPSSDVTVSADTFGSDYDTVLAAFTGTSLFDLIPVGCNDQAGGTNQSRLLLNLTAGTTYYFQIGSFGFFGPPPPKIQGGPGWSSLGQTRSAQVDGGGGNLVFNLATFTPPTCPSSPDFEFIVPDPVGDAFFGFGFGPIKHDITSVNWKGDATTFCLTVNFAGHVDPASAFTDHSLVGFVDFDTDENPATGFGNAEDIFCPQASHLGADAVLSMFSVSGGFATMFPSGVQVPVSFADTSFTAIIPLSALGGDNQFNFAMVLGTFPEPTDCAPNGGSYSSLPPDADHDKIPDAFDNCPTTANTDQADGDQDGIGDVCDPTPVHDLALRSLRSRNVTLNLSPVGSATLAAVLTVENLENYPELFRIQASVEGLPVGCEAGRFTGDIVSAIRRLGTNTLRIQSSITCRAGVASPGSYAITLHATVVYAGAGIEQNLSNNSMSTTVSLRIR